MRSRRAILERVERFDRGDVVALGHRRHDRRASSSPSSSMTTSVPPRSSAPPPPPARSPYTNVLVLVGLLVPLTVVAHVVLLFVAVPTPRATCESAINVSPSSWPSAHGPAIDRCLDDLGKLETILGDKGALLTRLRAANLRRCLVRARDVRALSHCIEGLNDGWPGQLTRWP
jgi:hypothetical protein